MLSKLKNINLNTRHNSDDHEKSLIADLRHTAVTSNKNGDYEKAIGILKANLNDEEITQRQGINQAMILKDVYLKMGNVKELLRLLEGLVFASGTERHDLTKLTKISML